MLLLSVIVCCCLLLSVVVCCCQLLSVVVCCCLLLSVACCCCCCCCCLLLLSVVCQVVCLTSIPPNFSANFESDGLEKTTSGNVLHHHFPILLEDNLVHSRRPIKLAHFWHRVFDLLNVFLRVNKDLNRSLNILLYIFTLYSLTLYSCWR